MGDEDFVSYGTPLKILDEDNVHKSKAPRIEDQIVTDEKGRRRFHGAFTGGFSAGYFNSVGSKEGFVPSTFVSSRSKREPTKFSSYTPQHFMDDEDLADHGIAPQAIRATSNFDQNRNSKRKHEIDPTGPIPGQPVLQDLLKPSSETMGIKILRKLGWRPGQGVGPRKSRNEKKLALREKQKFYAAAKAISYEDDSSSEEDLNCSPSVGFAPDDIESNFLHKPKSDVFGLGYKPMVQRDILGFETSSNRSHLQYEEASKRVNIKGNAFGVGAFEEEDEDIYTKDDMTKYDFDLRPEQEANSSRLLDNETIKGLSQLLNGFKLSTQAFERPKVYPLPTLPPDFVPKHKSRQRRFDMKESSIRGLGRYDLSTNDRKRILSDQSPAKVEIRSGTKGKDPPLPSHISSAVVSEQESSSPTEVSLGKVKPFERDSEKQKRYENYLKFRDRGMKDTFHCLQPKSMTDWEKESERREFERAAILYGTLNSAISSRFKTATFNEIAPELKDGLNEVALHKLSSTSKFVSNDEVVLEDCVQAARSKMYGKLTQKTHEWHPHRSLCKRFNVPDPFPDSMSVGVPGSKKEKLTFFNFLSSTPSIDFESNKETHRRSESESSEIEHETEQESSVHKTQPESSVEKDSNYGLKVSSEGPPTIDLFKAIFDDSGDEDLQVFDPELLKKRKEPECSVPPERSLVSTSLTGRRKVSRFEHHVSSEDTEAQKSSSSTPPRVIFKPTGKSKPAKGIFKDIDFEAINEYRNTITSNNVVDDKLQEVEQTKQILQSDSEPSDQEYGPPLPPVVIPKDISNIPSLIGDQNQEKINWREEKGRESKPKKDKKQKKSKKKKSKKEKKQKKEKKNRKKSKDFSTDSSCSSD